MSPLALVGACAGGVIGSLIWAGISYATNYEVGYVAWAVGGLVGFGSALLGGRGQTNGVICGVIALLSILCGKYIVASLVVDSAIEGEMLKAYLEFVKDSEDFQKLKSQDEYAKFMVDHHYIDKNRARDVTEEEIQDFTDEHVPVLEDFSEQFRGSAEWNASEHGQACRQRLVAALSPLAVVKENLDLFDVIFALLGIATAFKIGAYRREEVVVQ